MICCCILAVWVPTGSELAVFSVTDKKSEIGSSYVMELFGQNQDIFQLFLLHEYIEQAAQAKVTLKLLTVLYSVKDQS